jgi:hypothetical protein
VVDFTAQKLIFRPGAENSKKPKFFPKILRHCDQEILDLVQAFSERKYPAK